MASPAAKKRHLPIFESNVPPSQDPAFTEEREPSEFAESDKTAERETSEFAESDKTAVFSSSAPATSSSPFRQVTLDVQKKQVTLDALKNMSSLRMGVLIAITPEKEFINMFMQSGLLHDRMTCQCGCDMKLKDRKGRTRPEWRCRVKTCRKAVSLSKDSFFTKAKLSFQQMILLSWLWAESTPHEKVMREMRQITCGLDCHRTDFSDCSTLSSETIVDWYCYFREVCALTYLKDGEHRQIGGHGVIVEIDETCITKRKYNRGRAVSEQVWIFGGVERDNHKNMFMIQCPNNKRDSATLIPLIQRHIREGSIIMSDCWRAYNAISELPKDYHHFTVNHSENFVSPDDKEVRTQTVECKWQKFKVGHKNRYGTHRKHLEGYIAEFIWRMDHSENMLYHLWRCIAELYPLEPNENCNA